jgi:putative ATP-dependent endonuclease of OLD family
LDGISAFRKNSTYFAESSLESHDVQKLENRIMATRGDLLFSSALLLFEGETEEASLPIFAERYWGNSIHQLGLSFRSA